jgi:hypothetical protein
VVAIFVCVSFFFLFGMVRFGVEVLAWFHPVLKTNDGFFHGNKKMVNAVDWGFSKTLQDIHMCYFFLCNLKKSDLSKKTFSFASQARISRKKRESFYCFKL